MQRISMRRLAALAAAAVLMTAPASALAHNHRWTPSLHVEDGAYTEELESIPASAVLQPAEGSSLAPKALRPATAEPAKQGPAVTGAAPVTITSPSAILMEARSGRVLYEKNSHERRNPASVTKIMTLIIAFDAIRDQKVHAQDDVTISEEAAKQIGTTIFADAGETFSLGELLESVGVGSANDASVSVAEHVSGSVEAFVQAMNAKAKALGMHDTQFQNPTGLSAEGHFTSAHDIAVMSRYAANNYPELVKLTSIYGSDLKVPWRANGPTFRLWNNNKLLTWFQGADGLKTGWTEAAGYCLAATAVRSNVRMISVIMGADTWKLRNAEAAKLLEYGFSNYTSVELAPRGKVLGQVRVARGKQPAVNAVPRDIFGVSVAKGEQGKVKTELRLSARVEAPVEAGQVVGHMVATMDGKEVGRVDLVAATAVGRANLWQTLMYHTRRVFSLK